MFPCSVTHRLDLNVLRELFLVSITVFMVLSRHQRASKVLQLSLCFLKVLLQLMILKQCGLSHKVVLFLSMHGS